MKISVVTPTIRPEGLKIMQECLEKQTLKDFEWLVEVGIPKRGHDLNRAFNRMLRRAKGELVVFYEDYTKITADGLQKFWEAYQEYPKTFFTAPLGKTLDWEHIDWDWRAYADAKNMTYSHWEIDWGAAPLVALKEVGGFDETLDMFWSSDNVNTGFRAELAGYKFHNVFTNPAVALDHDKLQPHPFRENFNPTYNSTRLDEFKNGLKLDYLKE